MLEAPQMFPKGFHSQLQLSLPDLSKRASSRRRRQIMGIKYHLIGFGISSSFQSFEARKRVWGQLCQDQTVPELESVGYYDPFKVDIYTLGNVFKTTLIEVLLDNCFPRSIETLSRFERNTRTYPSSRH